MVVQVSLVKSFDILVSLFNSSLRLNHISHLFHKLLTDNLVKHTRSYKYDLLYIMLLFDSLYKMDLLLRKLIKEQL